MTISKSTNTAAHDRPMALTMAGTAAEPVEAELHYLAAREPAPRSIYRAGSDVAERQGRYAPFKVEIHDARPIADELGLDEEGFVLLQAPTTVTDFYDDEEVRNVYYGESERLIAAAAGAKEVVVFDHTVRVQRGSGEDIGQRAPVTLVHNDYTHKSGPQRVRDLLDAAAAKRWLQGRVAEYNLWRPIRGPVVSMPLAVCDAGSVAPGDLVTADLVYPDRVGEIYNAVHSPAHRWYYVPEMRADEAILLKGYDSETDGRARFTLHTAFHLASTPPDAPPRESIEIRALAFLG